MPAQGWTDGAPVTHAHRAKPALTTLMYLTNRPDGIADFEAHADEISIIAPQTFSMDAEGFIGGEVPEAVMAAARAHGVAVMPLVVNRGFNQPLMHTVLDTPASRARAIRYLIYFALRDGYIGFQFDYENIHYDYRPQFTQFFKEAGREFHRHGLLLSAAVVGKYSDDRNSESPGGFENWSGVYDYAAMGRMADFISVMAYPQHAGFSGPGPLAGYTWVQKIANFSKQNMPAHKVSLGIPLYGIQWTALVAGTGAATPAFAQDAAAATAKWKAHSVHYSEWNSRGAAMWDADEQSPHFAFSEQGSGANAEMWFENARSLGAKLELASQQGFAGVSGWVLGMEDPAFWNEVARYRVRRLALRKALGAKRAARMMESRPSSSRTVAGEQGGSVLD